MVGLAGGAGARAPFGLPPGWRVPAEHEPHAATLMQWPVSRAVYPDAAFLAETQAAIARLANAIAAFEPVIVLAAARHHAAIARQLRGDITLWDIPTEDLWARDSGPVVARGPAGGQAVLDFHFNGWGGRQIHRKDGAIARRVAERLGLAVFDTGLVGEAGGLDWNGRDTLIAHASSWDNPNRNRLRRDEITARLAAAYGAQRVVWADGLRGRDITDYHIDSLARFTEAGEVLICMPPAGRTDPFARAARATRATLSRAGFRLIEIAEPARPRIRQPDFVASYANFHLCNGAVICPEFGDPDHDRAAARALRAAFPAREVVQLALDPLGMLGGGAHCATQQLPAA